MAKAKQTSKAKGAAKENKGQKTASPAAGGSLIDANSAARAAAAMLLNRDAAFAGQSSGTVKQIKQDLSRGGLASLGVVGGKAAEGTKFSGILGGGKGAGGHHQKSGLGGNRQGVPRRTSNG